MVALNWRSLRGHPRSFNTTSLLAISPVRTPSWRNRQMKRPIVWISTSRNIRLILNTWRSQMLKKRPRKPWSNLWRQIGDLISQWTTRTTVSQGMIRHQATRLWGQKESFSGKGLKTHHPCSKALAQSIDLGIVLKRGEGKETNLWLKKASIRNGSRV